MTEDMLLPMIQPQRVLTRTINSTEYKVRLARPITEIDDFADEIMVFEQANPDDVVVVQVSSPGGSLETCDFLCRRMNECAAPIVVEIGLTCASAASALMLQADDWIIHDSSTVMIHACSYSPGWGKEVDVFSSATYTNRINREWVERTYRGFLSDSELLSVLDGKDLYFYADDLRERLPKYKEYREEKRVMTPCNCGSEDCPQNLRLAQMELEEQEDFEEMPTFEEMVESAVTRALEQYEKKKSDAEKKAARKAKPKVKPIVEEVPPAPIQ